MQNGLQSTDEDFAVLPLTSFANWIPRILVELCKSSSGSQIENTVKYYFYLVLDT